MTVAIDDDKARRLIRHPYDGTDRPLTAVIELTRRCNLKCAHCYALPEQGRAELPPEALEAAMDRARDLGALFVVFIGGDPTVSRHFSRLVRHAGDRHLAIQIFTNGTLIDEPTADELADQPVYHVGVSLYGATAATHDRIVGRAGAWERTVAGVRRLREREIPATLKFLIMESNFDEVEGMERLAEDLGVEAKYNPNVTPRDDLGGSPWRLRVGFDRLRKVIGRRRARPTRVPQEDRSDFACVAGTNLVAVNAYGDVFPCIMVPIPAGNLRYAPLDEIWRTAPFLRYMRERRHLKGLHDCPECASRPACDRCPGIAYMETGDLFGPSPSACMEALARRVEDGGAPALPAGLAHADSRLWNVHEILATMDLGCAMGGDSG